MAQDRATPEKKLLELIESPTDRTLREIKKKRKRIGFVSVGALKGRFSFFRGWIGKSLARQRVVLDIKQANIVLTFCVIGLVIYLAVSCVNATGKLNEISNLPSEITAKEAVKPFLPVSLLQEFSYYSQRVNSRNIFEPDLSATLSLNEEKENTAEEKIVTPKEELIRLIEYLVLVGVSWSDDPVAMIEDTDAKMTYFLRKSEEIKKGIMVKQVFIDRVILEYKGAEAELKL